MNKPSNSLENRLQRWFKHCPQCQASLQKGKNEVHCSACGFAEYLNPAPCVAIWIDRQNKHGNWELLVSKRGVEPLKGELDPIGGFVEHGESLLDAAARETKEETSLEVEKLVSLGDGTPDWYVDTPILGFNFVASEFSGEPTPQDDVADLLWLPIHALPVKMAFASAAIGLERYLEYRHANL